MDTFLPASKTTVKMFMVLNLLVSMRICSQTTGDYRSNVSSTGKWSVLASWQRYNGTVWAVPTSGQGYPGQNTASGTVTISNGDVITLDVSPANYIGALNFVAGGADSNLNFNTSTTLNVSNAITIPRNTGSGTMNTLAVGAGTLIAGSIAFTDASTAVRHQTTISTGTVTVLGNITTDNTGASASIIFTDRGLLQVGGQLMSSGFVGGTLTTFSGCTVEYIGAAQTARSDTYLGNLTLSGTGVKTFATTPTIKGVLSMEGTATVTVTSGNITYGSSATLQYNTSTARTAGSEWITPFTATGGVVIKNTGAITLNTNKTFTTCPLKVSAGSTLNLSTFTLGSPSSLALENGIASSTISGSAALTLGGNVTVTNISGAGTAAVISCPLALGSLRTFTVEDEGTTSNDLIISGVVSGAFGVTKAGVGTMVLSGTNTYTGATLISAGALNVQNIQGTGTTAGGVTVSAGAALELQGGITVGAEALSIAGMGINNGGALRNISGANKWGGAITQTASSKIASDAGTFTVDVASGNAISGTFNLTFDGSGNIIIADPIAISSGTMTKNGIGTLTLSGANSYSGGTTVNGGTLSINNTSALGSTSSSLAIASGAIANIVSNATVSSLSIGGSGTSSGTWGNTGSGANYINTTYFTSTGKITVTSNTCTAPTISGSLMACKGLTTQLTGSGTPAIASPWVSGTTGVATISPSGLVTGSSVGTSAITYTNNLGCTQTETVVVNSPPVPTFIEQPGASACAGTDVTFTTQPGQSNYAWTYTGVLGTDYLITSGGGNSETVKMKWLTTAGSKIVKINYVNANGCAALSSTSSVATVINPLPNNTSDGFTGETICSGTNGTITYNAYTVNTPFVSPYKISFTDGTNTWNDLPINSSSPTDIIATPTGSATYTLISITDGNNCVRTSGFGNTTAHIAVKPAFTAGAINTIGETICYNGNPGIIGNSTFASGGDGFITYKWQADGIDIPGANLMTYDPPSGLKATTTYTRWANDGTCNITPTQSTGNWVVTVAPTVGTPTAITVSAGIEPTCQPTNGTTSTTYETTAANSTGFNWSLSNPAAGTINTTTGEMTWAKGFSGSVDILVIANGCNNPPTQVIRPVMINVLPMAVLSGNTIICNGNSTSLSVSLSGAQPWSITYTDGTAPATVTAITSSPQIISVSPSVTSTYSITAVSDANCNGTSSGNPIVIVNPSLPVSINIVASANPTCLGRDVIFTATPTNGGTSPIYQWKVNGADVGTNSTTYSNSKLATGDTIDCFITSNEACSTASQAVSNLITMTIKDLPIAPTIGEITQPICPVLTGSVVLKDLPAEDWTINPGGSGTGNSTIVSGLPAGTTNFTVTDASGCTSPQSEPVSIKDILKRWVGSSDITDGNDWFNASNWDPTGIPDEYTCIEIPDHGINGIKVSISGTDKIAYANALVVSSNGNLNVDPGNTLIVSDFVNVNPGGMLKLEDRASLIQANNSSDLNKGNIIVERKSTPLALNDHTYWSSPTSGNQTLHDFSPHSNPKYFLTYDDTWTYLDATTTKFDENQKGIGYAIIAPKGILSPTVFPYTFTGVPNNGNVTVKVSVGSTPPSYKLIGNPYPSALDADAFILANLIGGSGTNKTISGTLYFWSRTTTHSDGSYSPKDYTAYNLVGGVPKSSTPKLWIASGQGFIVEIMASGDVIFTNAMRVGGNGTTNSNFYKNANPLNIESGLEKNRIWLNLTNGTSTYGQTLIGYIETATDGYDPGYDGTYNSNAKSGLYSLMGNTYLTIQGRALPFSNSDVVPLGYKTDIKSSMTISVDSVDGLFSGNQDIFIEDKLLNLLHNLKVAPYTFDTEAGTFDDRFALRYSNANLGSKDSKEITNNIIITSKDQQIKIQSTKEDINKVFVYDMIGRTIYENSEIDSREILVSDLKTQQVLIVKVLLSNGHAVTKKLVNK